MGEHLTWIELGVMFIVMFSIQFITRTKAVADGMMFRQIMFDNEMDNIMGTNEVLEKIKDQYPQENERYFEI